MPCCACCGCASRPRTSSANIAWLICGRSITRAKGGRQVRPRVNTQVENKEGKQRMSPIVASWLTCRHRTESHMLKSAPVPCGSRTQHQRPPPTRTHAHMAGTHHGNPPSRQAAISGKHEARPLGRLRWCAVQRQVEAWRRARDFAGGQERRSSAAAKHAPSNRLHTNSVNNDARHSGDTIAVQQPMSTGAAGTPLSASAAPSCSGTWYGI